MKKVIAILLSLVMMFAMVSVVAYAAGDDTTTTTVAESEESDGGHGNTENDDQYKSAYTVLNFFTDLFERLNLLFEYIVTVFFPNINSPAQA